jgi:hypothetical protein
MIKFQAMKLRTIFFLIVGILALPALSCADKHEASSNTGANSAVNEYTAESDPSDPEIEQQDAGTTSASEPEDVVRNLLKKFGFNADDLQYSSEYVPDPLLPYQWRIQVEDGLGPVSLASVFDGNDKVRFIRFEPHMEEFPPESMLPDSGLHQRILDAMDISEETGWIEATWVEIPIRKEYRKYKEINGMRVATDRVLIGYTPTGFLWHVYFYEPGSNPYLPSPPLDIVIDESEAESIARQSMDNTTEEIVHTEIVDLSFMPFRPFSLGWHWEFIFADGNRGYVSITDGSVIPLNRVAAPYGSEIIETPKTDEG